MSQDYAKCLSRLISKAQLSNQVSRHALLQAQTSWRKYRLQHNPVFIKNTINNLQLVINQVYRRETRINPIVWRELISLRNKLEGFYSKSEEVA